MEHIPLDSVANPIMIVTNKSISLLKYENAKIEKIGYITEVDFAKLLHDISKKLSVDDNETFNFSQINNSRNIVFHGPISQSCFVAVAEYKPTDMHIKYYNRGTNYGKLIKIPIPYTYLIVRYRFSGSEIRLLKSGIVFTNKPISSLDEVIHTYHILPNYDTLTHKICWGLIPNIVKNKKDISVICDELYQAFFSLDFNEDLWQHRNFSKDTMYTLEKTFGNYLYQSFIQHLSTVYNDNIPLETFLGFFSRRENRLNNIIPYVE